MKKVRGTPKKAMPAQIVDGSKGVDMFRKKNEAKAPKNRAAQNVKNNCKGMTAITVIQPMNTGFRESLKSFILHALERKVALD